MADVKVTYDGEANAAYIYFTDPQADQMVSRTYICNLLEVRA